MNQCGDNKAKKRDKAMTERVVGRKQFGTMGRSALCFPKI